MLHDWEELFIYSLAETGNVSESARVAGIERTTAYRAYGVDREFAARWDDAVEQAADALELEARRRAKDGCRKPVFHNGREIAQITEYSDTLLIFLLKATRPEKFREPKKIGLEELLAGLPTEFARSVRQALGEMANPSRNGAS